VLVEVDCETDFVAKTPDFQTLVKEIAMHIAAANPLYVTKEEVPGNVLDKEREIYKAQAAAAGKPAPVQEKIAEASSSSTSPRSACSSSLSSARRQDGRPAHPGEDRAHQGEHRGAPVRPLQGRRRGARGGPGGGDEGPGPGGLAVPRRGYHTGRG
jgi:hypothetical protein